MEIAITSPNLRCIPKQGLGSDSTMDADHTGGYDPIQIWQPIWIERPSPETYQKANKYCPKCLRFVRDSEESMFTENWRNKKFLCHQGCQIQDHFFTQFTQKANIIKRQRSDSCLPLKLGSRQFFVSLTLNHVLNSNKILSGTYKILLNEDQKLVYALSSIQNTLFQPTVVLIPMKQFSLSVQIQDILAPVSHKKSLKFIVDVTQEHEREVNISFKDDTLIFEAQFQIIREFQRKIQAFSQSNYKLPEWLCDSDIVQMLSFSIKLNNEQNPEGTVENSYKIENLGQSSPCSVGFHKERQNNFFYYDPQVQTYPPVQSQQLSPSFVQIHNLQQDNQFFISWIKTHGGSKEFQRKSASMSYEQIQFTVNRILPHISEIVKNDYANYMFQSLLAIANINQRILIIENMKGQFCQLACEQQGTFVFQQMVGYFQSEEEFQIICDLVILSFEKLMLDNYGNHFMRKLIQCMPLHFLYYFTERILQKFVEFSINKNGVCVLKNFLRALKAAQLVIDNISHEIERVLNAITMNSSILMRDEFGNYIIQEAYQIFGQQRLTGITGYILNNFSRLSCEKYSSNVIQNCLKKYWESNQSVLKCLKSNLQNKNIVYMYHNKDGNKVLLQIMNIRMQLGVKDKIRALITHEQASKFNNKKWMQIIGKGKTGHIGTSYNNFSEAHQPPKRKHYKN